jgi:hypothetical protein
VLGAHATVVAATFSTLLWTGCSPLIATVGVEEGERDHDAAPGIEPADARSPSDAAHDAGAGSGQDGGVAQAGDAELTPAPICIELPDLVGPITRSDGGVRALDSGVVWAAIDQDLGCAAPVATTGVPTATTVVYGRVDGLPLMEAGRLWTLRWQPGVGTGTVQFAAASTACGTDSPIPFGIRVLFPPLPDDGCVPGPGAGGQYMRLIVGMPTPFPSGLMLCDQSVCP